MHIALSAVGAIALGIGVVIGSSFGTSPATREARVTMLLHAPLATTLTPGHEVRVDLVRFAPGAPLKRQWHSGEEFHYYLEGEVEITVDGLPTIHGRPGHVGHVPFANRQTAVAGRNGAQVLVFRVQRAGELSSYSAAGGAVETARP